MQGIGRWMFSYFLLTASGTTRRAFPVMEEALSFVMSSARPCVSLVHYFAHKHVPTGDRSRLSLRGVVRVAPLRPMASYS
jgi:hypothetical protein